MSVINEMLKDLDQRQSQSSGMRFTGALRLHSISENSNLSSKQVFSWGLLTLAAGFLCLFIVKNMNLSIQIPTMQQKRAVGVLTSPTFKSAIAEKKIVKVSISEANWQVQGSAISLYLYLDKGLEKEVSERILSNGETEYSLPMASLSVPVPMLDPANALIESFRVGQREDDLVITIKTKKGIELAASIQEDDAEENSVAWVLKARPVAQKKQDEPVKLASIRTVPQSENVRRASNIKRSATPVRRTQASYQQALNLLQANNVSKAIEQLQKVLLAQPMQHNARELLANLYIQTGRFTEANVLLRKGIELDPAYIPYVRMYADSLIAAGQLEEARRILLGSASYVKDDADYFALQAAVSQRLAQHDDSVTYYMHALEIRPDRSAWWMGLAISLEALSKTDAAVGAYAAAIDSGQLNAELRDYVNTRLQALR